MVNIMQNIKCPICKQESSWLDNIYRPFCGERCKLIDLGNWADGSYTIQGTIINKHENNELDEFDEN